MVHQIIAWYEALDPVSQFIIGGVIIRGIFARSLAGFIQKNIFMPIERPIIKFIKYLTKKTDKAIARQIRDRKRKMRRKLIASSRVPAN